MDAKTSEEEKEIENLPLQGEALSVSLTVQDIKYSFAWYCDVLGFAVHQKYEREERLMAVSLVAGQARILITQDNGEHGTAERSKGEGFLMMITTAQNIDALAQSIKARGGTLESEPADTPWGQRMF